MLIVEDEPVAAEVMGTAFRSRGYTVTAAADGREALQLASRIEPDVVILDLGLPDIDGTEVCRQLRRWFTNPIIVVTADGDEQRMIAALDLGADDYVTKPFSVPQLLARLRVAMRHREALAIALEPTTFTSGDLRIDFAGHIATTGGEPMPLSRKEFALLALLARNFGRVLTHAFVLKQVWDTTDLAKTDTLRVHVTQLRKKLGTGPDRPRIVSQPGVGYRLLDPDPD